MLPPLFPPDALIRLTVTADATSTWVAAEGEVANLSAPQLGAALEAA
jgi:hypothetical protein